MLLALTCQVLLLLYHQLTTLVDLYPFNGARYYSSRERRIETCVNALLMSVAIAGFWLRVPALMTYAVIYYFLLFIVEIIIWWVPYLGNPKGSLRRIYNGLLAIGTSDFAPGDTLGRWEIVYERIHAGTVTLLPRKNHGITPNLEHMILHALTLITALASVRGYIQS